MAPRRTKKQVALKPTMEKVRVQMKRVKAEMGELTDDQNRIREEQRKIRVRFEETERQCHQLKKETQIIMKQSIRTQVKVILMFKILKARESGDFIQAATLTQFLREFVAKERADASLLAEVKNESP